LRLWRFNTFVSPTNQVLDAISSDAIVLADIDKGLAITVVAPRDSGLTLLGGGGSVAAMISFLVY
jgi:hypothetical protein